MRATFPLRAFPPVMISAAIASCAPPDKPVLCPDPAAVAPASIGGAAFVVGLTGRLGNGDEDDVVTEAIAEMRAKDPKIGAAAITNVLIAADCPVAAARPDHSAAADRARISRFRAQVDQLLAD